ncbi:MAG: fructose 1,6-bisphosphatase [Candidatus Heimdallarchaeota archaeon]|nr:fructose 1,6-bisphosphatase [Candidatus Heimdallarchaeota archaeon]MCK4955406.1 fructose 1,6-bisphosphatase [Candidatus Heimdallarchaeota archaeon]
MKTTISLIKADIGSSPGHVTVYEPLMVKAEELMQEAKDENKIIDFIVFNAGDDTELLMTHQKGVDNEEIHKLAWDIFMQLGKEAREIGLYGAGQDLLKDAFSGNIKGMGPGCAEIEIEERPAEPILVFAMDKTEPGAFNYPIFQMFANPFNTAGLIIDPKLHDGFRFSVMDIYKNQFVDLKCPEEMYDLLALIGAPGQYVVKYVDSKDTNLGRAAAVSTDKLALIAGKYVGKDDPVAIVRSQSGFPAVGEIVEAFTLGHMVSGWMRGSHRGPLMPVSLDFSQCVRFDGPPRVVGLGFQLKNGQFKGGVDLFDDPSFDLTRARVNEIAEYIRRHGPFEPSRLPLSEMEYTTLPGVLKKLQDRFHD